MIYYDEFALDLRDLKYFLGIDFFHSKAGVYMSQRKHAFNILQDTNSPHRFSSRQISNGAIPKTHTGHEQLVERLIYLTVIRPNIVFLIWTLSQYIQAPRTLTAYCDLFGDIVWLRYLLQDLKV